jgi:accessory colonization factor AcfC
MYYINILEKRYKTQFVCKTKDLPIYKAYFAALNAQLNIFEQNSEATVTVWLDESQYNQFIRWYNLNNVPT